MTDYKITFLDGTVETVKATAIRDRGDWIDFEDGGGLVLRVLAGTVGRIERA